MVTFCISSVFCDNLFFTYFRGDHELCDEYPLLRKGIELVTLILLDCLFYGCGVRSRQIDGVGLLSTSMKVLYLILSPQSLQLPGMHALSELNCIHIVCHS